jgi:diadenosine tetraphosphate (Ap4A) HIT family hydrolase
MAPTEGHLQMTKTLAEFRQKFQVPELEVVRTDHWTWSVRPAQPTLGAGILSLNRFATSLADLTPAEGADLAVVAPKLERALGSFSAPERMNYLMLMMVDAHVHFHVLPRYGSVREVAGQEWADPAWPGPPALGEEANRGGGPTLLSIRDSLRALAT